MPRTTSGLLQQGTLILAANLSFNRTMPMCNLTHPQKPGCPQQRQAEQFMSPRTKLFPSDIHYGGQDPMNASVLLALARHDGTRSSQCEEHLSGQPDLRRVLGQPSLLDHQLTQNYVPR